MSKKEDEVKGVTPNFFILIGSMIGKILDSLKAKNDDDAYKQIHVLINCLPVSLRRKCRDKDRELFDKMINDLMDFIVDELDGKGFLTKEK